MEIWKEILDTGWKVSSEGRIMNERGKVRHYRSDGYRECKYGYIHRIVAYYFCNPPAEVNKNWVCEGYEVHHIDRDPTNNNADNLVYLTHDEHKEIHKQKIKKVITYNKILYNI